MADEEKVYPAEEQGITKDAESSDERKQEMQTGDREEDVYSEEGREDLVDNDEITPAEEGFMEGEEDTGHLAKCAHCGNVLQEEKGDIIERVLQEKIYRFCSSKCAESGVERSNE